MKSNPVTIADIAKQASVSKATVSRVLNNPDLVKDPKRQAVLDVMGRMGFRPNQFARGLANGQTMTLGIVTQNIGTSFYDDIIRGIIEGLRDTPYSAIISDGLFEQDAENAAIRTLRDRHVDGIILLGGDVPQADLDRVAQDMPLVVVARNFPRWEGTCITTNNFKLGYEATKHLIDAGHREIAHVAGNRHHEDAVNRAAGYRQAILDAGIQFDPELIYDGNFYGQAGILAVESWLMRGKHFTAIFAANDLTAFGVRLALSRRNIRIPDEVSLIGIDDKIESALMVPPLTTIRQPAKEMGLAAATAMIEKLQGKETPSRVFEGEIKVRESVSHRH